MNLGDIPIGSTVVVTKVGGEATFRRRLMELGLLPGTRVEVVGVAPLGDPLELLVRGCSLSIRRSEAEVVSVALSGVGAAESVETEARELEPGGLIPRSVPGAARTETDPLHP